MKAKEFLKQYEKQKTIIASCWEEVAMWKDVAYSITGYSEGERVQSSGNKQKMADAVVAYSDIQADIKKRIEDAKKTQNEIISKIAQLTEAEYYVLHSIYILGKLPKQAAASKGKSKSWVDSMHGTALLKLQKILDTETKVQ